jgi:hypothetical protein
MNLQRMLIGTLAALAIAGAAAAQASGSGAGWSIVKAAAAEAASSWAKTVPLLYGVDGYRI